MAGPPEQTLPAHKNPNHTFTVFRGKGGKAIRETTTLPALTRNQVLVGVTHSGLCGTDAHYWQAGCVLGHEGSGVVKEIGPAVKNLKVGERVGWGYVQNFCGRCKQCLDGFEQYCPKREVYGFHNHDQGSLAYSAIWDENALSSIPEVWPPNIPVFDESLPEKIKDLNGGRRIDVVYSSGFVSPTVAHECWREIAPLGRFIDTGRKNVLKRSALDVIPMNRGASYMSFDILDLYAQKPHLLSRYLRLTASLYRQSTIKPVGAIQKRNLAELESAVASFADNFTSPKIVIEYVEAEELTIKVLPRHDELRFKADATYFLVGCLGGLGRSLTSWMIKRGAKRFAFMSRTGADKEDAALLIRDIEARGVTCQIIKGDAANKKDVEEALKSIPANYPVRGVVQAAMVLRDGLFHSMSYENWRNSISPKVFGTANLHEAFADTKLDFVVATSSTLGILGTPGQAKYAASNCFLDSLARHRIANGQRATSLVLPMVQGVGVVAENPEIEAALRRKGIYGIDETHLLQSFEAAMMVQSSGKPIDHIVVGMDPSKLQKSLSEADVTDGFWLEDARFKSILQEINATKSSESGGAGFTILKAIHEAATAQEAVSLVTEHFTQKLSRLLLLDLDIFEPEVLPIADYGLDSMIGAELRNWIFKDYALDIPFQQLLGPGLTIAKFAGIVCANQGIK